MHYRYTGKERDEESGLYYHGARYYIPWLCRWTAVDPLESKYTGMSPYNYSFNNPVVWNDLSGADPNDPGDDNSPPKSKGVVTVSFYPGGAVKNRDPDACGADGRGACSANGTVIGDGKDDWIVAFAKSNEEAAKNNPNFKAYGITDINEIGKRLNDLVKEGYTIGNVIVSGHSNTEGSFYLGGKHLLDKDFIDKVYAKQFKPYLSKESALILHSCNLAGGTDPKERQLAIDYLSFKINAPVFASMTFGTDRFSGIMSSANTIEEYSPNLTPYKPGTHAGKRNDPKYNNSVLFERMYYAANPKNNPSNQETPQGIKVIDLRFNVNGKLSYVSDSYKVSVQQLKNIEKLTIIVENRKPPYT